LNTYIKQSFAFFSIAIFLYGVSFLFEKIITPASEIRLAQKAEKVLAKISYDYERLLADEEKMKRLLTSRMETDSLDELLRKPYSLLIYKGSELIFWNENTTIPPFNLISSMAENIHSIQLQNGFYEISKTKRFFDNQDYTLIRLILLKSNFSVQNNYLQNRLNPAFDLPSYAEFSMNEDEGGAPVKNKEGKVLFYLKSNMQKAVAGLDAYKVSCQLLSFIAILFALFLLAKYVAAQNTWIALVTLAAAFVFVRWLTLAYNIFPGIYCLELFSPQVYASSAVNKSLGDLAINLLMLLWLAGFIYRQVKLNFFSSDQPHTLRERVFLKHVSATAILLLIFFLSRGVSSLFNSLLLDSKIPFDFTDFLNLNIYSFIGLGCITIALTCFALIAAKLLRFIASFNVNEKSMLYCIGISFLLYLGSMTLMGCGQLEFLAAVAVLLLIIVLQRMVTKQLRLASLSNMIAVISALSIFSSIYLYHYNEIRDLDSRKALARKLSIERDLVTEYLFLDVQDKILTDLFILNYFRKPFISTQEIVDRIKTKYFSGFFRKYDVKVFTLNTEGKLLRSSQNEYLELFNDEQISRGQLTLSDYLFYIPKPSGSFAYISNLPIIYHGKLLGSVVLELTPKTYSQTNLYPELLLEEKVKPPEALERYSYALYSLGFLVKKGGTYPYAYGFSLPGPGGSENDYYEVEEGGLVHLIYRVNDEKMVVVTDKKKDIFQPVSLFSYLFCIYLLLGLSLVLMRYAVMAIRYRESFQRPFSISFRDKIQFSMIFIIIFSFFVIGYVTIAHFTSEFEASHNAILLKKSNDIRTAVEYILKEDSTILSSASSRPGEKSSPINLASLSDIHGIDINIYDSRGKIANTSQPEIFEKGLLSEMMEPNAYRNVALNKKSQFIQNERIGKLKYISIYTPVRNTEGGLLAYLNLPYFAKERELNNEISSLLVTLVNVYVLLLVLAGFLAYLLSDSVTRSLGTISQKLKLVKLGKKNEPIQWKSRDEIGTLVSEYNKMLVELEKSAELLAKSERESAWREMAKQIAHEIKNPLTPMKLSIQHLQRASAEGDPRASELAKRVANTLIEQIDNLSHIASEFSTFAKMPKAQNEALNISDVIESVVNLFNEEKHLNIHFSKPEKDFTVYADKNQLLRAFNNLVKNASQAIPHEREGHVEIRLFSKNGSVIATVQDNGIGIPQEQQSKVFVPNFTTKSGGTGLGLALTKEIIENAKGKIWFESKENTGTTFFVELPEYKS